MHSIAELTKYAVREGITGLDRPDASVCDEYSLSFGPQKHVAGIAISEEDTDHESG